MRPAHAVLAALVLASCAAAPGPRPSGLETQYFDPAVRAQDDLYAHTNGRWIATATIPADRAGTGTILALRDRTLDQLRAIVEAIPADSPGDAEPGKVRDLYASFMDEGRAEALGAKPLAAELARVDAIADKRDVVALVAHFNRIAVDAPLRPRVHQDAKDPTRYVVDLVQSGLGMPDREYYLRDDDARLAAMRSKYRAHVEKMLRLAGFGDAAPAAEAIVALETRLARAQWTRVESRDAVKRYNPFATAELPRLAPGYDWPRYLGEAGIAAKADRVIVSQPSYLTGFAHELDATSLEDWKRYFRWRVVEAFAPYLSRDFADESFAFTGTVLAGVPQNRPRWQRGIALTEEALGQALGKLYVARHFPPRHKARMEALVANLLAAYRESIDRLEWMSPQTRREAQAKLALFVPNIGYPSRWRDYSRLAIARDDLVGNVRRANAFEYERNLAKLGKPIDRTEWHMSPQTVNAYYNVELNEIVFPAAILQPPFFDAAADDAANYGAIGAVIGHEISHGFDDQGSRYDGKGALRDWWTRQDHAQFDARTAQLVRQYERYSPVPGYHLNGRLTLGENIADNAGLAIALKAYRIALGGRPAPVIDGLTGEQRFFLGWAQVWKEKRREEESIRLLKIDPHSPGRFRADGASVNQDAFHAAFAVHDGDGMYLPPDQRVSLW